MDEYWARTEMEGADLWDRRCVNSLAAICGKLAMHAGESFSAACGSAGRQAAHRILEHPGVTVGGHVPRHIRQTGYRWWEAPLVLGAPDSPPLNYNGHRATLGLGPINQSPPGGGLVMDSALAVTPEGVPLGLLHVQLW